MSDILVDFASLSEDIREKLAELDLELSEGNIYYLLDFQFRLFFFEISIVKNCVKPIIQCRIHIYTISFYFPSSIYVLCTTTLLENAYCYRVL